VDSRFSGQAGDPSRDAAGDGSQSGYVGRRRQRAAAAAASEQAAAAERQPVAVPAATHEPFVQQPVTQSAAQQHVPQQHDYSDDSGSLISELHNDDERYEDQYDDHYEDGDRHHGGRKRGVVAALSFVLVLALVGGGFLLVQSLLSGMGGGPKDYTGSGAGAISVVVASGDTVTDIADTLVKADVVASAKAFVNAASKNADATSIQPGTYDMRKQMSGAAALALMLAPTTRDVITVPIPEGYRVDQVITLLSTKLGLSVADVTAATTDLTKLGLPAGFEDATSIEGFLFPATYQFQPGTTALQAVQAMTAKFGQEMSATGFVANAKAMGVTPYEALKVASMAEAEATNAADWAKVARVIYNRAASGSPLGIDSTSVYEARLKGQDPLDIDFTIPTPYNTRSTPGFPPTPIGNPGEATLTASVHPAAGNWLYYVQSDAAGTLTFTNDFAVFTQLANTCTANGWGNC
jgi:uncharacterized YceG family protein